MGVRNADKHKKKREGGKVTSLWTRKEDTSSVVKVKGKKRGQLQGNLKKRGGVYSAPLADPPLGLQGELELKKEDQQTKEVLRGSEI